jgi:DNA-binding NarL/FixJ family response regulator
MGNIEIAERLFLSPRTVERHVASLRQRTGQPDRARLIAYAREHLTVR